MTKKDQCGKDVKKSGKSNALKAVKNILKNAKKLNPLKQEIHYARDTEDGQLIVDGFEMVLLKEADRLPLEPMPENIKAEFNYKGAIPNNYTEELTLPDIKKLKATLKIKKAQYPKEKTFFFMISEKIVLL